MTIREIVETELGSEVLESYDKGLTSTSLDQQFVDGFKSARTVYFRRELNLSFGERQIFIMPYIEKVISEVADGSAYNHSTAKHVANFVNQTKREIIKFCAVQGKVETKDLCQAYIMYCKDAKIHYHNVDIGQLNASIDQATLDELISNYLYLTHQRAFDKLVRKIESFLNNVLNSS